MWGEDCPSPFFYGESQVPHLQNGNMNQRHKMSGHKSRKSFSKHASHTNAKNYVSGVMRGGIRF